MLVGLGGPGLFGGNEGRANVGKIGAHGLCGQHSTARGDGAAEHQRTVKPLANFLNQGKGAFHPGVAARACRHGNQAIGALLNGLVRVLVVDDVVQHDATIRVGGRVDVFARAQGRDDDGHLVLDAQSHVMFQPLVAFVHDLVDGKRCSRLVRMGQVVGRQRLGDFNQPVFQLRRRTRVQRGHGPNHAGDALGDHQLGVADDEQGRTNHRKWQAIQRGRQLGHGVSDN